MHAEILASRDSCDAAQDQPVILVVEDDELVRLSAAEFLRFSDFHVLEAATADEAVSMLAAGADVDLVFSDIRMPGRLDGFGLAQWLRSHRPALPVLLTTGFAGATRDNRRGDPILAKPYSFQGLLQKIDEMLPHRDGASRT